MLTVLPGSDAAGRLPHLRHSGPGGKERLPGPMPRGDRLGCCLVPGLQNVWVCAQDLQLIRADRIISLLVPIAAATARPPRTTAACSRLSARRSRAEPAVMPSRG